MWISRKKYESIMERLGDLERGFNAAQDNRAYEGIQRKELRAELVGLRDHFRTLVNSLGLVHRQTPAKEEYVKKGGPEHD